MYAGLVASTASGLMPRLDLGAAETIVVLIRRAGPRAPVKRDVFTMNSIQLSSQWSTVSLANGRCGNEPIMSRRTGGVAIVSPVRQRYLYPASAEASSREGSAHCHVSGCTSHATFLHPQVLTVRFEGGRPCPIRTVYPTTSNNSKACEDLFATRGTAIPAALARLKPRSDAGSTRRLHLSDAQLAIARDTVSTRCRCWLRFAGA